MLAYAFRASIHASQCVEAAVTACNVTEKTNTARRGGVLCLMRFLSLSFGIVSMSIQRKEKSEKEKRVCMAPTATLQDYQQYQQSCLPINRTRETTRRETSQSGDIKNNGSCARGLEYGAITNDAVLNSTKCLALYHDQTH